MVFLVDGLAVMGGLFLLGLTLGVGLFGQFGFGFLVRLFGF